MELNFLRSQIQPHFLFNTLNNIYGMVIENEKASTSILRLSDLLRFSLYDSSKGDITLREEMKFLTDYIQLEKMRHKESKTNIEYCFEVVDESLPIKPLLLVNFIENAFKHGVNASRHYSWVKICLKVKDELLTFLVENNKPPHRQEQADETHSGVGLANVRRRLELEYPGQHTLNIRETEEVYEVELVLKLKKI